MPALGVVGYVGALQHIRKRGAELQIAALERLQMAALQSRVFRKTIPFRRRSEPTAVVMFDLAELDRWIAGVPVVVAAKCPTCLAAMPSKETE